ncbi:MarR family transcriptional regulator [Novosphingobium sp.]|uniref:MarR family winged helix-turn-helix transcriptional regulator n=1 Tax=Novosphingobium sp. TaxID=1874826 RepID=UPI0017E5AE27|nr:MarR family transcriptional regulator [Novosphingobium sp.]
MNDLLATFPGYALRRAANAVMGELGNLLEPDNLRVTEAAVLVMIQGRSDLTASQIGKALDIQRANMVPLLNRLESAGLIRRQPIDGKSQAVVLSAEGEAKMTVVGALIQQFEQGLLERVPPEHRDHLLPALNAIWK